MECTRCGGIYSADQFFWNETKVNNIIHIKIDNATYVDHSFLKLSDFVEHEIRGLTDNPEIDKVIEPIYKSKLLVCLDIETQIMTLKEVSNLIITEIEREDDYS
ncbi:24560_t:CDS:2 [Cetraspora pellucida]|uniref:24560_t:CDS:1 n=1 Tax=Cetraspora pellucida TaxID=1433469 RepID=A0A9N9G191_9GLOM|nr:24560_t:CDS:2 [Cetraspora pellucida]